VSAEHWLPVVGAEEDYFVSSKGAVWSRPRRSVRGGLLRPVVRHGYLTVGLGRNRIVSIHSLVAAAFIGPRPAGMHIRHLDGDKSNNYVTNLCYGTPAENAADGLRMGRHHCANLTHCPKGHPYDVANTIWVARGQRNQSERRCRACRRQYERDLRARRRLEVSTPRPDAP
jgi:hypothetical protein